MVPCTHAQAHTTDNPRPVNVALQDTGDFAGVIVLDYLGMG